MSRFSEMLKNAREKMTVQVERPAECRDLAKRIGVTRYMVQIWEAGGLVPTASRVNKIAEAYGLPVAEVREAWAEAKTSKAGGEE